VKAIHPDSPISDRERRTRILAAVAVFSLALVLGACGDPESAGRSHPPVGGNGTKPLATAAVTGTAWPRTGAVTPAGAARFSIKVTLMQRSRVIATRVVPGGTSFHFTAKPGTYVVSSNAQMIEPVQVILRPGEVAHVDLAPLCK